MADIISKAERTRNFIIESTAEIFNKKGYAGTSLNDLTGATGLTKGSIYGNFANKEAVALAAFDHNVFKVTELIREQIDKAGSHQDKLMAYAKIYKKVIKGTVNNGGCPILNTAIEADDTNGLLKDRAATAVIKWEKNLTTLIESGVKSGEFKKDVNPRQISLSIIALIEGGVMISKVTGDLTTMDHVLNTVEMLVSQMKR